jgi:O-antigen ligase
MTKGIMTNKLDNNYYLAATIIVFSLVGALAVWSYNWSNHTLLWVLFVFGSLLGGISKINPPK